MNRNQDREVIYRTLDTDIEPLCAAVAHEMAKISDEPLTGVEPIWNTVGDLLRTLFDSPPTPEAQAEVTFTYVGYRVKVNQDATVMFVKVD